MTQASNITSDNDIPAPAASCPAPCCTPAPEKRGFLGGKFAKCTSCTGAGVLGLIAGHAGCCITPVVLATAGGAALTGGLSMLAVAFGAAATAGGLIAWHLLRGRKAGKWEKRIVIGSAISGLALSTAFHLSHGHDHHGHHHHSQGQQQSPALIDLGYCGAPPAATPRP